MDVETCAILAAEIAAAYPRHFISDLTLVDWTLRLAEIDGDERIPRIVKRLKNLPVGPPEPADFRQARRDEQPVFKALPAPTANDIGSLSQPERERWDETKARVAPWLREAMERIESGDVPEGAAS